MHSLIPTLKNVGFKSYAVDFDSVGHMIKLARANGIARSSESAKIVDWRNAVHSGSAWANGATTAKIDQWMIEPQPSLVAAVEDMKRKIEDVVDSPVRKRRKLRRNQEDGDELDPQAVFERRADGWTEIEHTMVPKQVVTIGVNLGVEAACKPQHLLYRGAATAAIADLLTQSGHSVEVVGFIAVVGLAAHTSDLLMRVPIKRADMPMDLTSLAVAVSQIGFFRMIMVPCLGRVCAGTVRRSFGVIRNIHPVESRDIDILLDADLTYEESTVAAVRSAMQKIANFGKVAR